MFVSLESLASALERETAWQKTPYALADEEYVAMIEKAVKRLYIDTGRALEFEGFSSEDDVVGVNINIDEEEYIILLSRIFFFEKVQTDVNNIVSYTTDALTVTSADKPYSHLQDTLENLERERRRIFYKMVRYTHEGL